MFIEFQLKSDILGQIVRNRMRSLNITPKAVFTDQGQENRLDRIEVGDDTSIKLMDGAQTVNTPNGVSQINGKVVAVISQQIKIFHATTAAILAANVAPIANYNMLGFDLLIDLKLSVNNGQPKLQMTYRGVEYDVFAAAFIPQNVKAMIETQIQSNFPALELNMDTSALTQVFSGFSMTINNGGISVKEDPATGSVLFFRLGVNEQGDQTPAWQQFFTGGNTDRRGGKDWCLLIDKDFLIAALNDRLASQVGSAQGFSLQSGPVTTYSCPLEVPTFDITFSGEVIDACICLFGEIDVDTDIMVTVTLSVPSNNTLRTHMAIDYDASFIEEFCCALTAAIAWPIVGAVMWGEGKIDGWGYFGGYLVGPLGVFIGSFIVAGTQPTAKYVNDPSCKKLDDNNLECDQKVDISMGSWLQASCTLESATGFNEGPALCGSFQNLPNTGLSKPSFSANPLNWRLKGNCRTGFAFDQGGEIQISQSWNSYLFVADPEILNDPLNVFSLAKVDKGSALATISVTAKPNATYLANPYPCRIWVVTNGGSRIINLGVATASSGLSVLEEAEQLAKAKIGCYVWISKYPLKINPKWIPDPPPDKVWQIWNVILTKCAPNEKVLFRGMKEELLVSARPTIQGSVQFSVFLPPENGIREAVLAVESESNAGSISKKDQDRGLFIKQTALVLRSMIPLPDAFSRLDLTRDARGTLLTITAGGGIRTYSLAVPHAPTLVGVKPREKAPIGDKKARAAAASHDGDLAFEYAAKGLTILHKTGAKVKKRTVFPGQSIKHAQKTRMIGTKSAAYFEDAKGKMWVADVADKIPRPLVEYFQRPYFVKSARANELFVRVDDTGKFVMVFEKAAVALYK